MQPDTLRCLVVDNHPVVRHGIRALLERELPGAEVIDAPSTADALATMPDAHPDVVVIDPSGGGELEKVVDQLRSSVDSPIVVFTGNGGARLLADALKAGVKGYVRKDSPPEDLVRAAVNEAARLTERAIADATFAKAPHFLALARRVQGQILGAQDRRDEAARAFDEAIAAFTATGSRLELARTMYHRAAMRFELGDRDAARADAANARDEFEAIEAVRDRAMAEVVLSK